MSIFSSIGDHSHSGGLLGALARLILRFCQFVIAITVAGLYGVDLHHAAQAHAGANGKWVYAEVVAGLSAFIVILYAIPFIKSYKFFYVDWLILVLWIALFGTFGAIFIGAHPTPKQSGQIRMKHAVWVDLVGLLLWFITAVYSTIIWWKDRRGTTLHTGRAPTKV